MSVAPTGNGAGDGSVRLGPDPAMLPPQLAGGLPVLGHAVAFMRDPVGLFERGYQEHGRIFALRLPGRRAVVLLGPEYDRFFFRETDRLLSIRTAYPFFVRMFDAQFYFFAEFEEYKRQRELVLPQFRGGQLDEYVRIMESETERLLDRLGGEGEFDLIATLGPLVMHIAAHAFLGPDFSDRMRGGYFAEFRRFSAAMDPVWPGWLPLPHLLRGRRSRDRLRRAISQLIAERRGNPVAPPDFLQLLCQSRFDDGEPVPDLVLVNLILMLTWAGHETTTGHLSWAIIDLLQNPQELDRARAEQRALSAEGEPLTVSAMTSNYAPAIRNRCPAPRRNGRGAPAACGTEPEPPRRPELAC
jgi:sterol 14alpha-demethylase